MKLIGEALARHLERELKPAYLVSGDEPLLTGEAADAIRSQARAAGYTERQVFFAERSFDWNSVRAESQSLSLFAERRILEVKLPGGKPGDGGAILEELVNNPSPEHLLLVITGKLERATLNSDWVKAFERSGVWVQTWPARIDELPAWIRSRMARVGLEPTAEAAALLAERVEGNLLAAQQEIEKLALLVKPGKVDAETLAQVVAESARYDVFQLAEAALAGDPRRALRILEGLRGEGAEPPFILWALARELRAVWEQQQRDVRREKAPYWMRNAEALSRAARRLGPARVRALLGDAMRVDRTVKGRLEGDPWDRLTALVARMAGVNHLRAA